MSVKKSIQGLIKNSTFRDILIMAGLFGLSLLIRLPGLKHGFPLLLHPDEGMILDQAFFMTRYGFWFPGNPGNFIRPNQILYLLNYLFLNLMSFVRFGDNLSARYQLSQHHFYHYARLLISVMGALIPPVTYQIGKLLKPGLGLLAGLVFLVFPSYVLHSLYITPDVPITLFTLLVLYFTLRYLRKKESSSLYLAVVFAAVNTAEKYPGLISLAIVFAGIVINAIDEPDDPFKVQLRQIIRASIKALLTFFLALFLAAPKLYLNASMALAGFLHSSRAEHSGADHLGFFGRLFFYVRAFADWSNLLVLLFIAAGVYALIKWRDRPASLLFYGLLYWVSLSVLSLHWERWALPMYLTPLLLIAIGISYLWERYQHTPIMKWVLFSIVTLYFSQQLITTVHVPIDKSFTDTRVAALTFLQANGITPENSLYEGYTPFQERQKPVSILEAFENQPAGHTYVILSSGMFDRFYQEPLRYPQEIAAYEAVRDEALLLARVEPDPRSDGWFDKLADIRFYFRQKIGQTTEDRLRGPAIEIYRAE